MNSAAEDRNQGMRRLLEVVARLRGEGGCPWDREQTLETLKPYLIEECYELIDAVDSGEIDKHREELGDVLLQILLHARIREEQGSFDFDKVADGLAEKLVRRHPHVFGDVSADTPDAVLKNWEAIKAAERGNGAAKSAVDGIPRHLPALQKAQRVQTRAARIGFDWAEVDGVLQKVEEEVHETREALDAGDERRVKEELGDLLFSIVNFSRHCGVDAEEALQAAVARFTDRFRGMEQRLRADGISPAECSLEDMDARWEAVKAELSE